MRSLNVKWLKTLGCYAGTIQETRCPKDILVRIAARF
jgi:hypothetical protein